MLTSTSVFLHDLQAVLPPVDSKIGEFHMISWQKLHVASLAIVSKIAFTLAIFFSKFFFTNAIVRDISEINKKKRFSKYS